MMLPLIADVLSVIGYFAHSTLGVLDVVTSSVAAASDDEGGSGWLLAAGPAAGAGVYWALFRYYRNTDKSHQFERETLIESDPVQGSDVKVQEIRGTQRTAIEGSNGRAHRQRVRRIP